MFLMLAVYAPVSLVGCLDLSEDLGAVHYGVLLVGPLAVREVANLQVVVVVLLEMAGCLEFVSFCRFWSTERRLLTISSRLIEE